MASRISCPASRRLCNILCFFSALQRPAIFSPARLTIIVSGPIKPGSASPSQASPSTPLPKRLATLSGDRDKTDMSHPAVRNSATSALPMNPVPPAMIARMVSSETVDYASWASVQAYHPIRNKTSLTAPLHAACAVTQSVMLWILHPYEAWRMHLPIYHAGFRMRESCIRN